MNSIFGSWLFVLVIFAPCMFLAYHLIVRGQQRDRFFEAMRAVLDIASFDDIETAVSGYYKMRRELGSYADKLLKNPDSWERIGISAEDFSLLMDALSTARDILAGTSSDSKQSPARRRAEAVVRRLLSTLSIARVLTKGQAIIGVVTNADAAAHERMRATISRHIREGVAQSKH